MRSLQKQKKSFNFLFSNMIDAERDTDSFISVLTRSKSLLEKVFDSIVDPIYVVDKDHTIVKANLAFLNIIGKKNFNDVIGKKCYRLFAGRKNICRQCAVDQVLKTLQAKKTIHTFAPKTKKKVYFETFCYPAETDKGNNVILHMIDITKRKDLEQMTERQNNRLLLLHDISKSMHSTIQLNVLLKQILGGILKLGFKRATVYLINEEDNLLEGIISTDMKQKEIQDIRIPINNDDSMVANLIKNKKPILISDVSKLKLADDTLIKNTKRKSFLALPLTIASRIIGLLTVDNKDKSLFLSENDMKVLQLFASDVALAINRALLIDRLNTFNQRLKNQIKKATIDLRAKNIRLKEVDKMKTELLSLVSHELRTPLTSIKGYSSLLLSDKFGILKNEQREGLEVINLESDRLKDVINDVIELSKLVSGKEQLILEPADVNEVIKSSINLLKKEANTKNIEIHFKPKKCKKLVIDVDKIKHALYHLISNAIKYNKPGGSVSILINDNPYFMQISVRDTGIGIERKNIDRIFEKFSQLEEHMTRGGTGTGVGLSIVKEIVDLHTGDIWVRSVPGKSSTFSFTIPRNIKVTKKSQDEYELAKTIEELETVRTIVNIMHTDIQLKNLLELILKSIQDFVGFDRVRLYLVEKDKNKMRGIVGIGTPNMNKIEISIEDDDVVQKILKAKKANVYHYYDNKDVNRILGKEADLPFVAMPLIVKNKVIGMLTADNLYSSKIITKQNLRSLTMFANTAAVAIENGRLMENMELQVKERTKELLEANERLKKLDKQKDEFMSYVSHELRTPLTSLIGYSKLILGGSLSKEQQLESINIINTEATRLKFMIDDFLDLAKMEAGKIQMNKESTNIKDLIKEVLLIMAPLAKEKNLSIDLTHDSIGLVKIDSDKIKQALYNLVGNAIKFTNKGSIQIELLDKDENIQVNIADTGIGIAKEDFYKVFDKFKQIQHSGKSSRAKGSGLGMPITKQIIESHQGKIWFESETDKGTTFSFLLPKK
ncbi:GAF domain-containing protein [Candidatus Woesearchaeota archaeon]|nr:GAF domain-containing protein [Candidatus Woesearchaeota archaeon]